MIVIRRCTVLIFSIVMVTNLSVAQEESAPDWKPLADFESVEAFEKQLSGDQEDCLAKTGGGASSASCFKLYELWDRELNIQYKRLREGLDAARKEKLKESQRDWIKFRDSTIAFNSHVLDNTYTSPGTMYIAMRASDVNEAMAAVVRNRTLMLRDWEKRWAAGTVDY